MSIEALFKKEMKVINIGIELFAENLKKQKVRTIHVAWRPPAGGNKRLAKLLGKIG